MELRPGNKYRIQRDGDKATLVVKDVDEGDDGEITCEVSNPKGKESAVAKLKVQSE